MPADKVEKRHKTDAVNGSAGHHERAGRRFSAVRPQADSETVICIYEIPGTGNGEV